MKKDKLSVIIIISSIIGAITLIAIHILSIEKYKNKQDRWLEKKKKAHMERRISRKYIRVPRKDIYEGC